MRTNTHTHTLRNRSRVMLQKKVNITNNVKLNTDTFFIIFRNYGLHFVFKIKLKSLKLNLFAVQRFTLKRY